METISLKMDKKMLKDIDETIKKHRYGTRTEFLRDAIRHKLSDLEKKELTEKIWQMKGSLKGKTQIKTPAEERAVREQVARDIAREHGIKLD